MIPDASTDEKPAPVKRVKPQVSLARWRETMGFTQREAAAFLEITQGYYYKLETKRQTPRPTLLRRLTERTGVPVDELMGIA